MLAPTTIILFTVIFVIIAALITGYFTGNITFGPSQEVREKAEKPAETIVGVEVPDVVEPQWDEVALKTEGWQKTDIFISDIPLWVKPMMNGNKIIGIEIKGFETMKIVSPFEASVGRSSGESNGIAMAGFTFYKDDPEGPQFGISIKGGGVKFFVKSGKVTQGQELGHLTAEAEVMIIANGELRSLISEDVTDVSAWVRAAGEVLQ
jgi:hypothetical protein